MHSIAARALFDRDVGLLSDALLKERKWTILVREYPHLHVLFEADSRTALRLGIMCDEWNALPPSIQLLSRGGGALGTIPKAREQQFNETRHPVTGLPFICMVGTREYHTHPSHLPDVWDNYRGTSGYELGGIVTRVWRAWLKATP